MICGGVVLLPHIIYIIAKAVSCLSKRKVHYRPYGYATLVMMAMWFLLFGWGHWFGRYFHEVKQVEVACKGLPHDFDGYHIVQISDLHLDGWEGHEETLQQIINEINSLHPDLIVFTGDIVSMSKDELPPLVGILKQLKAMDGVLSIMGNHDYLPYDQDMTEDERAKAIAELQRMERQDLGWNLLLNEHVVLHHGRDSIAIIGCENQSMGGHGFAIIKRGDLKKAVSGIEGITKIILTHDPTHWRGEILDAPYLKNENVPLTLSGHTHAGQFRVLGFSVARFIYKEYDGLYTEGDRNLYVNIGLGGTMPMRIGATPEVTCFTLRIK